MNNAQAPLPIKQPSSKTNVFLVAILLVAAAVAVGLIWHSKHKDQPAAISSNSSTFPSDWPNYKATKYDFMFNYPTAWSSPEISQTSQSTNQTQIIFSGNAKTAYTVVATIQPDVANGTSAKSAIQKTLTGDKKNLLKYDGGSYSTALIDPATKSIGQINLFQIVNLSKLKISGAVVEVLLNPNSKCAGSSLPSSNANGCFSQADYTTVSQFAKSIRSL